MALVARAQGVNANELFKWRYTGKCLSSSQEGKNVLTLNPPLKRPPRRCATAQKPLTCLNTGGAIKPEGIRASGGASCIL
jgi:transposase-like protein